MSTIWTYIQDERIDGILLTNPCSTFRHASAVDERCSGSVQKVLRMLSVSVTYCEALHSACATRDTTLEMENA